MPYALYGVLAELVKHNVVDIPTLVPHVSAMIEVWLKMIVQLAPTQAEILDEHRKRHMRARELANKSVKPAASIAELEAEESSKVMFK